MSARSAAPSRTLEISSTAIPLILGRPALEPVRLSGHEGVNSLFEYELLLKTPDALNLGASGAADFDLDSFIGREITCSIQLDGAGEFTSGVTGASADHVGAGVRQISALITDAAMWGEEGRHIQYRLTLRPWLHLAMLTTDCKIFQNRTVVEVLDELLGGYDFGVDKRLIETYPKRDYSVQYNESDFEFFSRLCQEWGISYFFEHSQGKHRLVLIDNMGAYKKNDSAAYQEVEYHAPGWKVDAEYVHSFVPHSHLTSGKYATRDYDYTRPRADLSIGRSDPRPTGQANGEVYQWHAGQAGSHYVQPRAGNAEANEPLGEGRQLALLRMQALRTHGARAKASGNLRGMVPGCSFQLRKHPREKANAEYLILDTQLLIEDVALDSQIKGAALGRAQGWKVEVDFVAHPMIEPLRPTLLQPKPFTHGPQSALVVGPEGQNLWTDELGRIKVQFPWDRIGRKNQHSSCWIRVSSPWAGNQLGGVHIPRIGQEVIVDFIGGDPDLPVCTGRLHNQVNQPPWALPGQQALSGFRTRELSEEGGNSASGRSNHLAMDDTKGKIQVQLKSDHQHSQLSLGHITRIEDNAGRKDSRGEGFELRSDGWGALRTDKGLLLSTDGRSQAIGGILSRDELVACLEQALAIAKDLAKATTKCEAGERDTAPQQALSEAAEALGHGADNEANARGKAQGGQPVLALSGAAGIASVTPKDHIQYAGLNIDTVAGHNQQHYADQSILHTAGKDIEQFARTGDIRVIANEGKLIHQAQHNSVEITGEKAVTIQSTEDGITIRAKKSITLALDDGTYLRMAGGRVVWGMTGQYLVQTANYCINGPSTIGVDFPSFMRTDQAQQLKLHRLGDKGDSLSNRAFNVVKASGGGSNAQSGGDAISKLDKDKPFDVT
ncbi:type VI secretion system Vgr family protein [Variovorax sp. EL159]|uniref:type VI secretion system Vgr family protein n=1 Tax=Variovorax sp. EL159 TaxID=1566270 RepID=UPI00088B5747|nr:type VI secretion system Vgr family protein [Variovorax sp. EL159]SCX56034.1 type VI secretion system secreted protein VgrG [Variovorax sp. EL159]